MPGTRPVAISSYDIWQHTFECGSAAIGEIIGLNGAPLTILGVTPKRFRDIDGGCLNENTLFSLNILMVASGCIHMICYDNVGYLMARDATRQREMATRLAVGSNRFRIRRKHCARSEFRLGENGGQ